jgi:uncharacterized protein with GYD domain
MYYYFTYVIHMKVILLVNFRRRITKADTKKTNAIVAENPEVKVISIDWTLGRYDAILIAEVPDEVTWLKFVQPLSEYVQTETLVAIPREEAVIILE